MSKKYFGYREWLAEKINTLRDGAKNDTEWSWRAISRKVGFNSPNYLLLVINGERHLSTESLAKVVVGLNLTKVEQNALEYYFFDHLRQQYEQELLNLTNAA